MQSILCRMVRNPFWEEECWALELIDVKSHSIAEAICLSPALLRDGRTALSSYKRFPSEVLSQIFLHWSMSSPWMLPSSECWPGKCSWKMLPRSKYLWASSSQEISIVLRLPHGQQNILGKNMAKWIKITPWGPLPPPLPLCQWDTGIEYTFLVWRQSDKGACWLFAANALFSVTSPRTSSFFAPFLRS